MGSDEARLDLTDYFHQNNINTDDQICELLNSIKQEIFDSIKITVSCGISCNMMLAKLCSEKNKPNGIFHLKNNQDDIENFMDPLEIRKIPGIGPQSEYLLNGLSIKTIKDLRENLFDLYLCYRDTDRFWQFGKACYGTSNIYHFEKEDQKSISRDMTFKPTFDIGILTKYLEELTQSVCERATHYGKMSKCVSIGIKYNDFRNKNRQKQIGTYINSYSEIFGICLNLLKSEVSGIEDVRLLRVKLTDLIDEKDVQKNSNLCDFFGKVVKNNDDNAELEPQPEKKEINRELKELFKKPLDDISNIDNKSLSTILGGIDKAKNQDKANETVNCDKQKKNLDKNKFESADFIQEEVICPVCNTKLDTFGNISYTNRHIDNCLKNHEKNIVLENLNELVPIIE